MNTRLLTARACMLAIVLLPLLATNKPAYADEFAVPCGTLPFEEIRNEQDIDAECAIDGDPGADDRKKSENRAKNNFCAQGTPTNLTFPFFKRLQNRWSAIPSDERADFLADRGQLADFDHVSDGTKVGEGSVVRVVAFVFKADHSNWRKKSNGKAGESVNCKTAGRSWNDVHVALVRTPPAGDLSKAELYAAECESITAEISPHFRPESWEPGALTSLKRPVRITGHLFLDNSHVPCRPGKKIHPARQSVWEIHPVYRIEVCSGKAVSFCSVGDDAKWTDLHDWIEAHAEESEPDE